MPSIPDHVLLACERLGPRLPAETVAAAIAQGLIEGDRAAPDVCLLDGRDAGGRRPQAMLDALGFDERMRSARAVVLAVARLRERTLIGSVAFEAATRARQAGVPSYAVAAQDDLDSFDARILDLQVVLQAGTRRALVAAGRRLAEIV